MNNLYDVFTYSYRNLVYIAIENRFVDRSVCVCECVISYIHRWPGTWLLAVGHLLITAMDVYVRVPFENFMRKIKVQHLVWYRISDRTLFIARKNHTWTTFDASINKDSGTCLTHDNCWVIVFINLFSTTIFTWVGALTLFVTWIVTMCLAIVPILIVVHCNLSIDFSLIHLLLLPLHHAYAIDIHCRKMSMLYSRLLANETKLVSWRKMSKVLDSCNFFSMLWIFVFFRK